MMMVMMNRNNAKDNFLLKHNFLITYFVIRPIDWLLILIIRKRYDRDVRIRVIIIVVDDGNGENNDDDIIDYLTRITFLTKISTCTITAY